MRCTAVCCRFGGTFLMFSEILAQRIRMAALMKQRVIHVFTHDSIPRRSARPPAGEQDRHPAHIPTSTSGARVTRWRRWSLGAFGRAYHCPTCHISAARTCRSWRVMRPPWPMWQGRLRVEDAAGARQSSSHRSEVELAVKARRRWPPSIAVRVVSMPSTTPSTVRTPLQADVLPKGLPRVAVEPVSPTLAQVRGLEGAVVASTPSANPPRRRRCSSISASTTRAVVAAVKGVL